MPYFFPYEDLFVYITAALIVGLLFLRVRLARRQRERVLEQETAATERLLGKSAGGKLPIR